jgi:hypothetical protein
MSQALIQEFVTFITSQTLTQEDETLTSHTLTPHVQIFTQGREIQELEQEYKEISKVNKIIIFIIFY